MSATYQHPIRTGIPLVIAYPTSGPAENYAQLHADGCNHVLRYERRAPGPFAGDEHYYADDFFLVAPCAKAPKGRKISL